VQEHSCVINIGVAKNLDMLNTLITFLDPVFADHLSECFPLLPPHTPPGQAQERPGPDMAAVSGHGAGAGSMELLSRPWEEGPSAGAWCLHY
jgi:hypothetical protein